jgi:hypothetical protein
MVTAYLAVAIIVGHYVLAFQPALDPFRGDGNEAKRGKMKSNPLDVFFLSWRVVGKEGQQRPVIDVSRERRRARVEAAFEKVNDGKRSLKYLIANVLIVCIEYERPTNRDRYCDPCQWVQLSTLRVVNLPLANPYLSGMVLQHHSFVHFNLSATILIHPSWGAHLEAGGYVLVLVHVGHSNRTHRGV